MMHAIETGHCLLGLTGGEWCEEHVINVVSNRVNLHFRNDHDPAKGHAIMVAVEEMQNAEKFRFGAESGEPA